MRAGTLRRAAGVAMAAASLAVGTPAPGWAAEAVVVVRGSNYYPGDDDLAVPTRVTVPRGSTLTLVNFDLQGHSLTEDYDRATPGDRPLFSSPVTRFGSAASVTGIESAHPGIYGFTCMNHPGMHGVLEIVDV